MKTRRVILIFLAVFLIGFIGLCGWGYRLVTRSIPRVEGHIALTGLGGFVEVYRDGYHVPHIIAEDDADLYFAQGYITAQDRLWQMDLSRRRASGRLAEIFGSRFTGPDSVMHLLGITKAAGNMESRLSPASRVTLQRYTDGVNACLADIRNRLPIEFNLLGYYPSEWTISDCISCFREFFWRTGWPWQTEFILSDVRKRLSPPFSDAFLQDFPFINGGETADFRDLADTSSFTQTISLRSGHSWAVRTENGAILATAAGLPVEIPAAFYETQLTAPGINVTGLAIPGFPGIVMGQNRNIAWAFSRLHSADEIPSFSTDNHLWSGLTEYDDAGLFLSINHAESWSEFRETLKPYNLMALVFTYADSRGNIGLIETGTKRSLSNFNPPSGFITDSREAGRAEELLAQLAGRDMRSIKTIQSDIVTEEGRIWKDLIVSYASGQSGLVAVIEKWDGLMKAGSSGAAVYAQFLCSLAKAVLEPELGEPLFYRFAELDELIRNGLIRLFKGNLLSAEEKREYIDSALKETESILRETIGDNPAAWSWGALHSLTFRHTLGTNSLLSQSLNRGPFQMEGDGSTLFEAGSAIDGSHDIRRAATARLLMDTDSPDNSAILLAPGQSGHALDEHYRDQIQLFLGDMVHATLMDTSKIRRSGWKRLILQPESPVR